MTEPSYSLFVCDCADIEHQLVIQFDPEEDFNDSIILSIHLSEVSLLKRIYYGIRYILGKKSRFNHGAFAEVLLNKDKTKRLIELLQFHYSKMV